MDLLGTIDGENGQHKKRTLVQGSFIEHRRNGAFSSLERSLRRTGRSFSQFLTRASDQRDESALLRSQRILRKMQMKGYYPGISSLASRKQ